MDFYFLAGDDDAHPVRSITPLLSKALLLIQNLCLAIMIPSLQTRIWSLFCRQIQAWIIPHLTSYTCKSTSKCSAHQNALIKEQESEIGAKSTRIVGLMGDIDSRDAQIASLEDLLRKEKEKTKILESKLSGSLYPERLEARVRGYEDEMTAVKNILSQQQVDLQELESAKQNVCRLEQAQVSMSDEIQSLREQLQKERVELEHSIAAKLAVTEQQRD